jgi:putative ABC transport system substrate-binding protein
VQTRRAFLRRVTHSALGAPLALGACAPAASKPAAVPRIAFLSISSENTFRPFLVGTTPEERKNSFLGGLEELGYREGETIRIDYRWAGSGDQAVVGRLADELVALTDLRLFVAHGNAAVLAFQKRTKLPIVMANGTDPVENGIVASLAQPGGNVTGIAILNNALTAKRMELLKEIVPSLRSVAYLVGPTTGNGGRDAARAAATDLGLRFELMDLRSADQLEGAFRNVVEGGVQGVVTGADAFTQDQEKPILALLLRYRLPAVHYFGSYTRDGGMATLVQSSGVFQACGKYVDRILKGTPPATLPIEVWAGTQLIVNPRGARAVGIELPSGVVARATEVVN